jgi:N-glycosylase/DNA lyase
MKKNIPPLKLLELKSNYRNLKSDIRKRLNDFSAVPKSEYFYELAYCLLTPQSSAVNADKVISLLKTNKFKSKETNPEPILRRKDCYIRFHKNKSRYLIEVKEQFPTISTQIANNISSEDLRLWLVKNVKGLGWKESSHFLRNIGHRNLAILDRHILRNLVRLKVLPELPKTLTAKNYLQIEEKFRKFSKRIGIQMDELDLLFWCMETGQILK